jgi:hypothetical protein
MGKLCLSFDLFQFVFSITAKHEYMYELTPDVDDTVGEGSSSISSAGTVTFLLLAN